jgi:glycosyltransferase involved in cell wall biosynthesis
LNQTYENLEVIVVDNFSTDRTWSICQEFAARDNRVKIYQNTENVGPVRNWRRCIELANGQYSKILFSDDTLLPACISSMLSVFEKLGDQIGIVYSSVITGESIDSATTCYNQYESGCISSGEYLKRIIQGRAPFSPGAVLLRTNDLRENLLVNIPSAAMRPYDAHGAGPDILISLLTMTHYASAYFICEPLAYFRSHADSFSVSNKNNQIHLGYMSAMAYFLMHYRNPRELMDYHVFMWIKHMRIVGSFVPTSSFIKEFEGRGGFFDEALLLFKVIGYYLRLYKLNFGK